MSVVLVRISF